MKTVKFIKHSHKVERRKMRGKRIVTHNKHTRQDATAVEIVFTELAHNETPSIGSFAEIDGMPASGKYVMPDGRTFVFNAGKLANIIPASKSTNRQPDHFAAVKLPLKDKAAGVRKYLAAKNVPEKQGDGTADNRFSGAFDRVNEHFKNNRTVK